MKQHLLPITVFCFFAIAAHAQSPCDPKVYQGTATYYTSLDDATGTARSGNCSFVNDDVKPYYGAAYTPVYDNSNFCGVCAEVTGKKGTQIIEIVDQCPTCKVDGDIDLSPAAFKVIIGDLSIGTGNITWHVVACPLTGKNVRVVTQGSNQWYAKVIIEQHVNKINKVEIKNGNDWVNMKRTQDNGWENSSTISIAGNTQVRVTDVYGEQVVVDGVEIASGTNKTFTGTSNFKPCTIASVEDALAANNILLYPNPACESIVVDGVINFQKINVFNTMGELVMTTKVNPSKNTLRMNLSNLKTGIYTMQFVSGSNAQVMKKFAKQ